LRDATSNSDIEFFPLDRRTFLAIGPVVLQLRKKKSPPRFLIFALAHAMPPPPSTTDSFEVSLENGGAEFSLIEFVLPGDETN
jgi:hypothetical protein